MVMIVCAHCKGNTDKPASEVNRAKKRGAPIFCGKPCFYAYRKASTPYKTDRERKEEKRIYDKEYRKKNKKLLKKKKADYYQRTKDPEKERIKRKERMHLHVAYCQRPEYRAYKKQYDRKHRANKMYGEYAECFLLTNDIRTEVLERSTDYEVRYAKGRASGAQKRRRESTRAQREESERSSVGNAVGLKK